LCELNAQSVRASRVFCAVSLHCQRRNSSRIGHTWRLSWDQCLPSYHRVYHVANLRATLLWHGPTRHTTEYIAPDNKRHILSGRQAKPAVATWIHHNAPDNINRPIGGYCSHVRILFTRPFAYSQIRGRRIYTGQRVSYNAFCGKLLVRNLYDVIDCCHDCVLALAILEMS
jgi:hypothetical protein